MSMGKKRKLVIGAVAVLIKKFGRKKSGSVTLYRSSRKSKTLHQEGCRYYDATSLAQVFNSLEEAGEAGYRPCKICIS
jgi:methylphosphotriester-DNA--protein-cysteine methyltransferase